MIETPNERRSRQARQALDTFSLATRRRPLKALDADEAHEALSDLLCDLRHLADRHQGLDYAEALERAARHHHDEVLEEELADQPRAA